MALLRSINLAVAFLLELCMLAALGYWGFTTIQGWPRIVLGLAAPLLAAVVWGVFLAPKAARPLDPVLTFWLKGAMLSLGAVALVMANRPKLAIGFALAVALNMLLLWLWRE
ncbi:YrdB family protein [Herpetosiphon sp. NSE202]|uniref:YrdB family protein n=1 Tax=Herpetosiphon sp. NSE202 TaxID=3351349 RepID=UPI00363348AD